MQGEYAAEHVEASPPSNLDPTRCSTEAAHSNPSTIVVTGTGFHGHERQRIRTMVQHIGGQYSGDLVANHTTHLVVHASCSLDSQKVLSAHAWHIPVVPYAWIEECIAAGRFVDHTMHAMGGTATAGPSGDHADDSTDPLFDNTAELATSLHNMTLTGDCSSRGLVVQDDVAGMPSSPPDQPHVSDDEHVHADQPTDDIVSCAQPPHHHIPSPNHTVRSNHTPPLSTPCSPMEAPSPPFRASSRPQHDPHMLTHTLNQDHTPLHHHNTPSHPAPAGPLPQDTSDLGDTSATHPTESSPRIPATQAPPGPSPPHTHTTNPYILPATFADDIAQLVGNYNDDDNDDDDDGDDDLEALRIRPTPHKPSSLAAAAAQQQHVGTSSSAHNVYSSSRPSQHIKHSTQHSHNTQQIREDSDATNADSEEEKEGPFEAPPVPPALPLQPVPLSTTNRPPFTTSNTTSNTSSAACASACSTSDVTVLRTLSRVPRSSTAKEHHGLRTCRGVVFAESIQCNHCAVTLSTKEKRRCAVLSLPPDVHIAEVQALYAIPPAGPAKEPTWWIEYCSLYRVDQVKQLHEETVMSQDTWQGEEQRTTRTDMEDCLSSNSSQRRPLMLPPDVDQSNELIRGTCRKHARVDAVQGEVVVRKSKAGMGALRLRGAGGAGGLYYRMGYDEQTGQLVTDRPVSDFAS